MAGRDLLSAEHQPGGRDLLSEEFQPQKPSLMQRAADLFTGDLSREYDYPELPGAVDYESLDNVPAHPATGEKETFFRMSDLHGMSGGNPLSLAEMYEARQGVAADYDAYGNPFVTYKGEPHYINRPGVSSADVSQALVEFPMFTGGGFAGSQIGKVAGTAGKVLGAGAGMYGTSLGQDLLAQSMGSKQPASQQKAVLLGLLGSAGEVASPLLTRIVSYFKGLRRNRAFIQDGELTDQGREAVRRAGLDPDVFDREVVERLETINREGAPYDEAVRDATAESLPYPVRLTRGEVSGDIAQQGREQSMKHATPPYTEEAQRIALEGERRAQQALSDNIDHLAGEVGGQGQRSINEVGQGTGRAVEQLGKQHDAAKKVVDEAYKQARSTKAWVPAEATKQFLRDAKKKLIAAGFRPSEGKLGSLFAEIERRLKMKGIKSFNLNQMEVWRKRAVRDADSLKVTDASQAKAIGDLKRMYDDFMQDALEKSLISGDDAALGAWRNATARHAEFAKLYRDNKLVNRFVKEELTPEEATQILFGTAKLSSKSKGMTIDALRKIKKSLGADSVAWNGLREEAMLRLLRNQPAEGFSAQKFVSAFDDAMTNGRTLMGELFNPQELQKLRKIRDVAKMTVPNPRATNPSRTSYALMRQIGDLFGPTGNLFRSFASRIMGDTSERMATDEARRLLTRLRPTPPTGQGAVVGGAAGTVYSSNDE